MDSDKLIYRIAEQGLTFADVSDMIDIDHLALYRKLAGFEKVTVKEAEKLKKILDLTNLEALEIFLDRSEQIYEILDIRMQSYILADN